MIENNIRQFLKLRYAIFFLLSIVLIGFFGYLIIEDTSVIDALYMSVITISTVGFKEVIALSTAGKIFTIILILVSWLTLAFALTVITSTIVEVEIEDILFKYRNRVKFRNMKDHVIIVGYGRNGKKVADEFDALKTEYVIIDKDHQLIISSERKKRFVEGDATEDEVLIETGVKNAKAIICTLPVDADNLFVVITARSLNKDFLIISRASQSSAEKKLLIAGADKVIMPENVGGSYMASVVNQPDVANFLNEISLQGSADTNLVEIECDELPESLKSKSIADLHIRKTTGANIVGFKTAEGEFIINPGPDTKMVSHSKLFVLGTNEQIRKISELFK
jgi:voltage-gated potassium channel